MKKMMQKRAKELMNMTDSETRKVLDNLKIQEAKERRIRIILKMEFGEGV
jgi:predicted XRE-type DNA-binding protein